MPRIKSVSGDDVDFFYAAEFIQAADDYQAVERMAVAERDTVRASGGRRYASPSVVREHDAARRWLLSCLAAVLDVDPELLADGLD